MSRKRHPNRIAHLVRGQLMLQTSQRVVRRLIQKPKRPLASQVLTTHIRQRAYPNWTSFSVKYKHVSNDQFGLSHFNWDVDGRNYHILRTGSFPYIKYYCMQRPVADLEQEDSFYTALKVLNLGFPCFAYGVVTWCMVTHKELVHTDKGTVPVYFLNKETKAGGH